MVFTAGGLGGCVVNGLLSVMLVPFVFSGIADTELFISSLVALSLELPVKLEPVSESFS